MGDAEAADFGGAPETSFSAADGVILKAVQKSDVDDFRAEDVQQDYDNPAFVLEQLLPIDMSSPTLLISETPPAKNHAQIIHSLLDAPPPGPDSPPSEDFNPFHDAVFSENGAQIKGPDTDPPPESEDQLQIPVGDIYRPDPEAADNLDFSAGSDSAVLAKSVSVDSPKYVRDSSGNRVLVDSAAPIESVKDAVSTFGGIVDWKAHKIQTVERQRFIEQELDKANEDVPIYRKLSEAAEEEKVRVLKELEAAKRVAEEMKLNVERAQTEELQAKQDAELVKLRVEEMEQGVAEEASVAARAQLEVAKARQAAAVCDLRSAEEELEALRKELEGLVLERDEGLRKVAATMAGSEEVERTVQRLTVELISAKESLESAHAVHLEAEERRLGAAMDRDQSSGKWGRELKEVEDEVGFLGEQVLSGKDLQSKLDAASALLEELKSELANYMESKDDEQDCGRRKSLRRTHTGIQASVTSAETELEDVGMNIEKAMEEVELLKFAASALESELESENGVVGALKQRERKMRETVATLEIDVDRVELELAEAKVRETEARGNAMNLPVQLRRAAQESEQVKSEAQQAREELTRIKEVAEQAKAEGFMMESRLMAAEKEMEAAKASEILALAAMKALQGSKYDQSSDDVTVSLEEYYELSKRAHEAEEQAKLQVQAGTAQVEEAKESQLRSLEKLEEVDQELAERKEALKIAVKKSEEAYQGKSYLEEELRKWRAASEQKRQASDSSSRNPRSSFETRHESSNYIRLPTAHYASPPPANTATDGEKAAKKKKKSFFPRILMFMARRKAHSSK